MLVLVLYLIKFGCVAITYISNNLIAKMNRQLDSSETNKINFNDKSDKNFSTEVNPSTSNTMESKGRWEVNDELDTNVSQSMSYLNEEENTTSEMSILKFPTPKDATKYSMNLKRRGKCVIFNHTTFLGKQKNRDGSIFDQKAIENTFSSLGFEPVVYLDLTYFDIMEEINKLCNENHEDCDCICIFLLTHGADGGTVFAKDMSYPFQSIWIHFTADRCPTLASKPKLFFIQACRGSHAEEGVQGKSATDSDNLTYVIPTHADFLFSYSTMDGYYAFRDPKKGSWYIQSLCSAIQDHWRDTDLLRMLTITARMVSFGYVSENENPSINNKKQMPTITSTLTRDLYFTAKDNHTIA